MVKYKNINIQFQKKKEKENANDNPEQGNHTPSCPSLKGISNSSVCEYDINVQNFDLPRRYPNNSKFGLAQPDIIPSDRNQNKKALTIA